MSEIESIFIGPPQATTAEADLLLELAEELDISWEREVIIEGADDAILSRESTMTIDTNL